MVDFDYTRKVMAEVEERQRLEEEDPVNRIRTQLAWQGPTGRVMGHVVLTREQAERLIELIGPR